MLVEYRTTTPPLVLNFILLFFENLTFSTHIIHFLTYKKQRGYISPWHMYTKGLAKSGNRGIQRQQNHSLFILPVYPSLIASTIFINTNTTFQQKVQITQNYQLILQHPKCTSQTKHLAIPGFSYNNSYFRSICFRRNIESSSLAMSRDKSAIR